MLLFTMKEIKIFVKAFLYLLWIVIRTIFSYIQYFVWMFTGTYRTLQCNYKVKVNHEKNPAKTAQILQIVARHKFSLISDQCCKSNFLSVHKEFCTPEYVLQDHVTLYSVTKQEAVFVEVKPGVDVTSAQTDAFMRVAQFQHAKNLIVLPIHVFHDLAEAVGLPQNKPIVFMFGTARCGGTLMTNVFEETGKCGRYDNPGSVHKLLTQKHQLTDAEYNRCVKNIIALTCKNNKNLDAFVFKTFFQSVTVVPTLKALFPDCILCFMYRNIKDSVKSSVKIFHSVPTTQLVEAVGRISKSLQQSLGTHFYGSDYKNVFNSDYQYAAFRYATKFNAALELQKKGYDFGFIRFEDILEDTEYAFRKLFSHCGLAYDPEAVERAMGRDSQRNSFFSRKSLKQVKVAEITPEERLQVDNVCKMYNFPNPDEVFVVPGTITYRSDKQNK